ncbi:hypothetical protein R1sor_025197 [Riccia sorocarpa]|uniref:Fucosyltransferase n=1 Tax=Riccia sorocarpa TaxID=122646 RepID=A0ABD3GBT3_9MARC
MESAVAIPGSIVVARPRECSCGGIHVHYGMCTNAAFKIRATMTFSHRNGQKSKILSVVVVVMIALFCLVSTGLLRVSYGENYGDELTSTLQAARWLGSSSSSSSAARLLTNERGALARRPFVEELISKLRDASQTAARGEYFLIDFPGEERGRWIRENPCKCRSELNAMFKRRKWTADVEEDDGLWDAVLEEYSKLHRICMRRVGPSNLGLFFKNKKTIKGCKFAIADYSTGGGLGNKILAVTNTILYAILTQRVVLVPTSTLLPSLMCEPFVGSSWLLDSKEFPIPPWNTDVHSRPLWKYHREVYEELDRTVGASSAEMQSPVSSIYAATMEEYQYQPNSRFFCDVEQDYFKRIPWLYFTGCLYSIPKLFAIPAFRATLEELFPSKLVLTRVLRSVMLPNDSVWNQIIAADAQHLKKADRRVGLQIRYRYNQVEYDEKNSLLNERILKCGLGNEFLPALRGNATDEKAGVQSNFAWKVFVASLFPGFVNYANENYVSHRKMNGEVVSLVQLSQQKIQSYGLEVDQQSLVEIFLLSFSDDLVVSPLSTFGGVAQAYGNLLPWYLEFRNDGVKRAPCQRAQTVDVCYQEADQRYSCPYDQNLDKKRISDVVPYIQKCLEIDALDGLQLITKDSSGEMEFPLEADPTADLLE